MRPKPTPRHQRKNLSLRKIAAALPNQKTSGGTTHRGSFCFVPAGRRVVSSGYMMPAMLLEEPTIMERALPITVEQYHALFTQGLISEKTELLEGLIIEKMPKSPLHSSTAQKLSRKLRAAASEAFDVRQEQPITCRRSEPAPDLALVAVSADDYALSHPQTAEVVIEIAISSAEIDRRKASVYAEAGVREYWIVLPESRQIEVHTQPTRSGYAVENIFTEGQAAVSEVLPDFCVELSMLFPR